jgi:hypothetical protein
MKSSRFTVIRFAVERLHRYIFLKVGDVVCGVAWQEGLDVYSASLRKYHRVKPQGSPIKARHRSGILNALASVRFYRRIATRELRRHDGRFFYAKCLKAAVSEWQGKPHLSRFGIVAEFERSSRQNPFET